MADKKSLSQQFLDAYMADPIANPWGQFYQNASSGSVIGDLNKSFQQYGALVDPLAVARQARSAGETPRQVSEAARQKRQELIDLRRQSYNTYKETYGAAQDLYRQMRAEGFDSEEDKKRAQQGLAAVREAAYLPHLANRGYLEAQQKLTQLGYDRARGKALRETLALRGDNRKTKLGKRTPFGGSGVSQKEALQLAYNAVKDVGQGGAVTKYPMSSAGESLIQMMREPISQLSDQRWMEKNRPSGSQADAGYQSRSGSSSSSTSGGGAANTLGAMVAGVATAVSQAAKPSINLGAGGRSDVLNTRDIKAAREEGMTKKEIRQAVRSGDIQMSARARARLFKNKK